MLPLSIGDGELAETADTVVSMPEIFRYWLQGGRIDVGFLGAAQIDRFANINTTVIGDYDKPKVRLPGAGGAPEIAAMREGGADHPQAVEARFVDEARLHHLGRPSSTAAMRASAPACRARGRRRVITDLGILEPDPVTRELTLTALHPGVTRGAGAGGDRLAPQDRQRPEGDARADRAGAGRAARAARAHAPGARDRLMGEQHLFRLRPEPPGSQPANLHPAYGSTVKRAPQHAPIAIEPTLSEATGPLGGGERLGPASDDLTRQHQGEPLGERIVVVGRVLDENGRPVPDTLIELWQANAAGRYRHPGDQHDAPLDPNFGGGGRCLTDSEGRYRFVTIKPGAYPWRNHHNAWRPAHMHFSLFGPSFGTRLVTQMYFPGDPLLPFDPIFNSIPDAKARERMVSRFDLAITEPGRALGYAFDIVLRGAAETPMEPGR